MPKKLTELPQLHIANPCPQDWNSMHGDDQKRFCNHCSKHVLNFSEMTSQEVKAAMAAGGSVCAQIRRSPQGEIVTRDLPSRRSFLSFFATAAAALLAMVTLAGCADRSDVLLGDVCGPKDGEVLRGLVAPPVENPNNELPVEMGDVVMGEAEFVLSDEGVEP